MLLQPSLRLSGRPKCRRRCSPVSATRRHLSSLTSTSRPGGGQHLPDINLPIYPQAESFSGMRCIFLGTVSCTPSSKRNVSSLVVHLGSGEQWMFDCGEGTQHQIRRTNRVYFKSITKCFITHMHADHVLGLPTVLLSIVNSRSEPKPVEVFGPRGLRQWLRMTLKLTHSKFIQPSDLLIHELYSDTAPQRVNAIPKLPQERDIVIYQNGTLLFDEGEYCAWAAQIEHTVPCFGYVVQEKERPGRIDAAALTADGIPPGPIYKLIKHSKSPVRLPNGTVIDPAKYVRPPSAGRKLVILGDTNDPSMISTVAHNADVLIHEATLPESDFLLARERGHSTASMAGKFAKSINAKNLVLNHFSAQIDGEEASEMRDYTPDHLVAAASRSFDGPIVLAQDFMWFDVYPH